MAKEEENIFLSFLGILSKRCWKDTNQFTSICSQY